MRQVFNFQSTSDKLKFTFLTLLGLYLFAGYSLIYSFTKENNVAHAIISMGAGLILLWVILCGLGMHLFREKTKQVVQSIRLHWQVKFILFCTFLAMLEEAIATLMTNLAPFFGVQIGQAYITASTNYFDVILHHSVIVFIPFFLAWAWILNRYNFSPFWVFLLFGVNGILGESIAFGPQNPIQFAMWIFVYGLMIYLPTYTLPAGRDVKQPGFWHGILAFILPLIFGIVWSIAVNLISPNHPSIHFPPIQI